jgi:hypothetical protein
MWTYRNLRWAFEVTFPDGWQEYGFMRKLLRHYDPTQPEFVGPKGADIKFAIGPISPVPTLKEMQRNLEAIAEHHGHWVVDIQSITVAGKEHATIVYHIPLEAPKPATDPLSRLRGMLSGRTLRLKNYHIIIGKTEFVVTGKIALFDGPIGHIGGRPVQDMSTLYAHNEDYDDILRTFRLVGDRTS